VVYDPAHAAELDSPAAPKANAKRGLDFPGLSTSTLADLYGDNGDASTADDDSSDTIADTTKPTPRDPPLASMSHKDLVELLFAGDDDLVSRAARELASRGLAAVPALAERFPGRLKVDPFDPGVNVRTAAALGPLVDVLGRLGNDALDAAITHVDSRYPAHRFAAVLLFALTPDARAMDLLRNRLHDAEPRIQKLAAEALVPFLAHPRFESLLVHLRDRAAATTRPYPAEARRRATELLGEFRDVGAVPLLLTLLSYSDLQETARQALRAITLQDFGSREKAWEKWWTRAKKRSRLDWLLDGLSSEEFELRSQAHRELADLAGDDFGYRADGDKRARQRAVEVWQQWWLDEQRRAPPRAAHLG
jgi:HEAT repeat protein